MIDVACFHPVTAMCMVAGQPESDDSTREAGLRLAFPTLSFSP